MSRIAFPDAAVCHPAARWQATWIWCAEPTDGVHNYVYFRREVRLGAKPRQLLVRLAAQRDATLWINGVLVGYGPPISDPRFQRYATFEVTDHLGDGNVCIAVRVYHDAGKGGFTAHSDARGLLCQLEADGQTVAATDVTWRNHRSRAYVRPVASMGDSMWPEIFDASQEPHGWQQWGFDESAWPASSLLAGGVHGLWGAEQPRSRFFPWVNLIPSETKPLRRTVHRPAAVVAIGEVLQQREASAHDVAVRMSLESVRPLDKAAVINADALMTEQGSTTVRNSSPVESYDTFDGLRNATVVLDFGRLMNARLGFRLKAGGGVVDIGYAWRLDEGRVVPYVSLRTAVADQYLARPGIQQWQSADWRHFRYVQLTFRDLAEELVLDDVWAEEIQNEFAERGAFASSDARLDRLFEIVRTTTRLNVVDRSMDNPSRERKQYLGDCSAIVPAITSCFGDAALLRRYFANAREGQHGTGQYRYSYPGHDNDRASLFDHALSLPLRVWEHFQLCADCELLGRMWPGIERFLDLAASCLDDDAMMSLPPYNIWFDWGHMDRRGNFLPLQAMTAEALRCGAQMASLLGHAPDRWAELAKRMRAQIPRWYDAGRGMFVDAIVDGVRQTHGSEHGLSLVAMWGQAPAAMIQTALDHWAADPSLLGQTSPAWMYLPAALIRAGRPELAIGWMHRRHDQLAGQGLDTWPETWCLLGERTLGRWRCRNSRAVAQGAGLGVPAALILDLCGIQPGAPGFTSVRLVPQPGPLTRLSATQPGPDGDYHLALEQRGDHWLMALKLPGPRPVVLDTAFAPDAREMQIGSTMVPPSGRHTMPDGRQVSRFAWTAGPDTEARFPLAPAARPGRIH